VGAKFWPSVYSVQRPLNQPTEISLKLTACQLKIHGWKMFLFFWEMGHFLQALLLAVSERLFLDV